VSKIDPCGSDRVGETDPRSNAIEAVAVRRVGCVSRCYL